MKKEYEQPTIEITKLETKEIEAGESTNDIDVGDWFE